MEHTDPSAPPSRYDLNVRILRFWTRPGREVPERLARDLLAGGRAVDAAEIAEAALARTPASGELLRVAGKARMQRGQAERGRRYLEAAEAQGHVPEPPGDACETAAPRAPEAGPSGPLQGVRVHRSVRVDDRLPEDVELDRLLNDLEHGRADHAL